LLPVLGGQRGGRIEKQPSVLARDQAIHHEQGTPGRVGLKSSASNCF